MSPAKRAPARQPRAAKGHISARCAMGDHDLCTIARCTCRHHGLPAPAAGGNGQAATAADRPRGRQRRAANSPTNPAKAPGARAGAAPNGAAAIADRPRVPTFAVLGVDQLVAGPRNPRRNLGDLEGLAASIRAVGIIEPLAVEPLDGDKALVLAGHRRLAAARLAGLSEVPCVVRALPVDDATRIELALVENLQRADLEPLDEAEGYRALVGLGLSQRVIAERVGCSQSHVSKRLALLDLPAPVRKRVERGTLPLEAAAALVRLTDHPERLKAAAGEDPSRIAWAVEQAEADVAFEAKVAELWTIAGDHGWSVVDEPDYWATKRPFRTLVHWNGPPELDVDARAHEAEPCHAVMLPTTRRSYGGPPRATPVCTEAARHTPKGDSALKAKAPRRPDPSPGAQRESADNRARKEAAAARRAVLRACPALGPGRGPLRLPGRPRLRAHRLGAGAPGARRTGTDRGSGGRGGGAVRAARRARSPPADHLRRAPGPGFGRPGGELRTPPRGRPHSLERRW